MVSARWPYFEYQKIMTINFHSKKWLSPITCQIGGTSYSQTVEFLDLELDNQLTWAEHIEKHLKQ